MDTNKIVHIYVLYDPKDCKIRYIGRTSKKEIKHRLIEHITKARYFNVYYPGKKQPYRINWINSILKQGREPMIRKIATVKGWKESHNLERSLIFKYKNKFNLVNSDDKGDGGLNKKVSIETKRKLSKIVTEYHKTHESASNKQVEVYDLDGNFINNYKSATEFAKKIKASVRSVTRAAHGDRKSIKNYQIKYSDSDRIIKKYSRKKAVYPKEIKKRRIIFNIENVKTQKIKQFCGVQEVCDFLNFSRSYFHKKFKKTNVIIGDYRFIPSSL